METEANRSSVADLALEVRREVMCRARRLCLEAEPHTHELPCVSHVSEADRQYSALTVRAH